VLEGWIWEYRPTPVVAGVTDPVGIVLSPTSAGSFPRIRKTAYLRAEGDASALVAAQGRYCLVRGVLTPDAIRAGRLSSPILFYDQLDVTALRAFDDRFALRPRERGRILRDLFERGVDYARDGAPEAADGPTIDGTLPDGRRARIVPLVTPPTGSADMFAETAYVDGRARTYWAVRTGGFAAVTQWVGPFPIPPARR
jgi:hypothetical protein